MPTGQGIGRLAGRKDAGRVYGKRSRRDSAQRLYPLSLRESPGTGMTHFLRNRFPLHGERFCAECSPFREGESDTFNTF